MGVIYTRTSKGDVLRAQPDAAIRQSLLERWYWPHHSQLEGMVNDVVMRSGGCLIVDCHSFPSVALPYELVQTGRRADFCVGTDSFHTPSFIAGVALNDNGPLLEAVPNEVPPMSQDPEHTFVPNGVGKQPTFLSDR
jgi:hypothetical protein